MTQKFNKLESLNMSQTNAESLHSSLRAFLAGIVRGAMIESSDFDILTVIYNNEESTAPFILSDDVMNYEVGMFGEFPALRRAEDGALFVDFASDFEIIPEEEEEADGIEAAAAEYERLKDKHADAILLFRVGESYMTFNTAARSAAEVLRLDILKMNGRELCMFGAVALGVNLPRLIRAGHRVAIVDSLKPSIRIKL